MKYIKLYESYIYEGNPLEETIKSHINNGLINDLFDMSLDYIDKGLTMYLLITDCNHNELLYIDFNHKMKDYSYEDYTSDSDSLVKEIIDNIKEEKLKYYFELFTFKEDRKVDNKSTNELQDRIRLAYPDESINHFVI